MQLGKWEAAKKVCVVRGEWMKLLRRKICVSLLDLELG